MSRSLHPKNSVTSSVGQDGNWAANSFSAGRMQVAYGEGTRKTRSSWGELMIFWVRQKLEEEACHRVSCVDSSTVSHNQR